MNQFLAKKIIQRPLTPPRNETIEVRAPESCVYRLDVYREKFTLLPDLEDIEQSWAQHYDRVRKMKWDPALNDNNVM